MSERHVIVVGLLAALAVALAAAAWHVATVRAPAGGGTPAIDGSFALVDHRGRPTTDRDFRGDFMLVYFGYTNCPDICPTTLAAMSAALDRLGDAAARVQPIFITVDPARDTVEVVADYVAAFHSRLVGLTGTREQVAAAAEAYRVYHGTGEGGGAAAAHDDPVNHTAYVYLMGPDGDLREVFAAGTTSREMAAGIRDHL